MRELLSIVVMVGCSKSSATKPLSKEPPTAKAATTEAATTSDGRFVVKTIRERTGGTPYRLVTATPTTFGELDRGTGITLSDGRPSMNVIAGARDKAGVVTSWTLFSLDGRELAKFPLSYSFAPKLGKARIGVGPEHDALLDLKSGAITEPAITLPGNRRVEATRIAIDDGAGRVWVFAKFGDFAYYGIWRDLAQPKLELRDYIRFWPDRISTEAGVVAGAGDYPRGCHHVALHPGAAPQCDPDWGTDLVMADRYWVSDFAPRIFDTKTQTVLPIGLDCGGNSTALAVHPAASRVLVACGTNDDRVQFALWSPDQMWKSPGPDHKLSHGWVSEGPPVEEPVVALERYLGKEPPFTDWLDMTSATIYTTPPLSPLLYGYVGGFARRFLATSPTNSKELWVVDLAAGYVEKIASDIDCKAELQSGYESADRATLVCAKQTGVGFVVIEDGWSEVIDFAARKRTRYADVALTEVTDDGHAVGQTLTRPMRVAVTAP